MNRQGFTLVEVVMALLILTLGILGLGYSAGGMSSAALEAEVEAAALQATNDRVDGILLHSEYAELDSVFDGVEDGVGAHGFRRTTEVERRRVETGDGDVVEYTTIRVTVSGARLDEPVTRSTVVGAP